IEVVEVTPVDGVDTDDEEPTLRGAAPAETDAEDEDDAAATAAGNDAAPANGGDDTTATADGNDAAPANGNDDTAATADGNDAAPANDDDIAVTADGNDATPANNDPAAPVDETGGDQAAGDDEAQQADPTFRLKRDENETGEEVTFSIDVVLSEDNDWTVTLTDADVAEYVDFNEYSWDDITFTVDEVTVDGYETSYEYDEDGLGVIITNTHEVPDPVQVTLSATKILNGRDLQAGEFSFQLLDANDAVVETVTNAADGAVNFSAISFDAAGTYTYSIVEVAGSLGGVTYDTTKINVTVTVTNNEGTLAAAVAYSTGDAAQFTNTYEPADATATITARKVLTGRALQAGEFSFQLINDEGTVYQTVTNAADGSISFAPITYSSEGTYTYTIAEVAGSAEGVTYDSHRFTVTVTVEDNGQGALVATVSYPTQPVFSNIYVPPIVPTGDHTNVMFYTVLALAAAAVCVGTLISRRRAR
ncbi:MAG: Cna B-type domain-containing protein, partial [Lachnospiraceae bacterium]|nr:Cna B-type domain-containing protein [Lachnospiraceae bacterium]